MSYPHALSLSHYISLSLSLSLIVCVCVLCCVVCMSEWVGGREKEREGIGNMRGEEREGAYQTLPLLLVCVCVCMSMCVCVCVVSLSLSQCMYAHVCVYV